MYTVDNFFLVLNRPTVEHFKGGTPYILISFYAPETPTPKLMQDNNRIDMISIVCHDNYTQVPGKNLVLFTEEQARDILNFVVKHLPKADKIVCQCEAGVSRSAAVAAVLGKILFDDDTFIALNSNFLPNPLIYKTLWDIAIKEKYYDKMRKLMKEKGANKS